MRHGQESKVALPWLSNLSNRASERSIELCIRYKARGGLHWRWQRHRTVPARTYLPIPVLVLLVGMVRAPPFIGHADHAPVECHRQLEGVFPPHLIHRPVMPGCSKTCQPINISVHLDRRLGRTTGRYHTPPADMTVHRNHNPKQLLYPQHSTAQLSSTVLAPGGVGYTFCTCFVYPSGIRII